MFGYHDLLFKRQLLTSPTKKKQYLPMPFSYWHWERSFEPSSSMIISYNPVQISQMKDNSSLLLFIYIWIALYPLLLMINKNENKNLFMEENKDIGNIIETIFFFLDRSSVLEWCRWVATVMEDVVLVMEMTVLNGCGNRTCREPFIHFGVR